MSAWFCRPLTWFFMLSPNAMSKSPLQNLANKKCEIMYSISTSARFCMLSPKWPKTFAKSRSHGVSYFVPIRVQYFALHEWIFLHSNIKITRHRALQKLALMEWKILISLQNHTPWVRDFAWCYQNGLSESPLQNPRHTKCEVLYSLSTSARFYMLTKWHESSAKSYTHGVRDFVLKWAQNFALHECKIFHAITKIIRELYKISHSWSAKFCT